MTKTASAVATSTIGERIERIILELAARHGKRLTLKQFGVLVGRAEKGRRESYSATGVSEWIQNRNEPRIATIEAMAKVSGRSREWIAFGEEAEGRFKRK